MNWLMVVPIGVVLGWITIQDFRERQISLVGLVVLFVLCIVHSCLALQWRELFERIGFNSLFAGIILVSGTLLVRLRRPGDPVSSLIGSGDMLFLLAISPLFTFGSYLVFLNTSMILMLLIFGSILVFIKHQTIKTIPFAGGLALCLIIFLLADVVLPVELLEKNDWLIHLMQ